MDKTFGGQRHGLLRFEQKAEGGLIQSRAPKSLPSLILGQARAMGYLGAMPEAAPGPVIYA